jgi:hypothetical protein
MCCLVGSLVDTDVSEDCTTSIFGDLIVQSVDAENGGITILENAGN